MKKINNKGITTIEVIVCFVLVVMITIVMYSTITGFNERRLVEGYKSKIYTYKNVLTKEIQDDFIKIGLNHATTYKKSQHGTATYTVDCTLQDGTKRRLVIDQFLTKSDYHIGGTLYSREDYSLIKYGVPGYILEYPIPYLGESKFEVENASGNKVETTAKDLSINNVLIGISEENVLSIYIGFYHPELGTRYAINIVAPINYKTTEADVADKFKTP